MDDLNNKKIEVKKCLIDKYNKCYIKTRSEDKFEDSVEIYISTHFYHGHGSMTIDQLREVHGIIGEFLKTYDHKNIEIFQAGEV